ncbi:MAG: hypothetical protein R2748_22835, partial [Bryobacterales bacterium]
MDYLILRIVVYLAASAFIGGATGWFVRRWFAVRDMQGYVPREAYEDLETRLQHSLRQVAAERNDLKTRVAELEKALGQAQAPLREAEAKLAVLEQEKTALDEECTGLRESNEALRAERQRLLENRASLTESIEQCEANSAKLEGEREMLLERIAGLEVEKAADLARFRPAPKPIKPVSVEEVSALFESSVAGASGTRPASAGALEIASYVAAAHGLGAADAPARSPETPTVEWRDVAGLSIYRLTAAAVRESPEQLAARLDGLRELGVSALALLKPAPQAFEEAAAARGFVLVDLEATESLWP